MLRLLKVIVHCHVGSLEIILQKIKLLCFVHCHVGSLEKANQVQQVKRRVHCHVGSLETMVPARS